MYAGLVFLTAISAAHRVAGLVSDLSHGYRNNTVCWDNANRFEISGFVSNPKVGYTVERFATPEHCGTHLDAPYHFNRDGWKLGEIPLERTFVQGVLVDVSAEVNGNGGFLLTADHFEAWESANGPLPDRSVVLVNFGWSHKFGNVPSYYHDDRDKTALRFPGLSAGAARWIVDSGKVYGLGVDGPSVDAAANSGFDAHKILAEANVYVLENVALNGTALPPKGFTLVVQPVKILEGTGAPCRVLAVTRNELV